MSKESADKIILSLVEQYDADKTQKKAVDTIKKIFENILKFPTEQKYRNDCQIDKHPFCVAR